MENLEKMIRMTSEEICKKFSQNVKLPEFIDEYYRRDYMGYTNVIDAEAVIFDRDGVMVTMSAYIHINETNNGGYEIEDVKELVIFITGQTNLGYDILYPGEDMSNEILKLIK